MGIGCSDGATTRQGTSEDACLEVHGLVAPKMLGKERLPIGGRTRHAGVEDQRHAAVLRESVAGEMRLGKGNDPRHTGVLTTKEVPDRVRDGMQVGGFDERLKEPLQRTHAPFAT